MISRGLQVDIIGKNLLGHFRRNAETSGGVFSISDNQIGFILVPQPPGHMRQDVSTRLADYVGDEYYST